MIVDVSFRIIGESVPLDHGYALYGSLSRMFPAWHEAAWLAIHPLNGFVAKDVLVLSRYSRLRLRLPLERLPEVIMLAGKRLRIEDGARRGEIQIGIPEVYPLLPSPTLHARCVTIKVSEVEGTGAEPDRLMFLASAEKQLAERSIKGAIWIDDRRDESGRERSRRVLHIKDRTIVGYAVTVRELSDEDSLKLQESGLGGRKRMGCGVFVPVERSKQ